LMSMVLMGIGLGGCAGPKRTQPVETEPLPDLAPAAGTPTLLAVGLLENETSLELSTNGPALVLDGASGRRLARLDGAVKMVCSRDGRKVTWRAGGSRGTSETVILQPVDPGHRVISGESEYRGEFLVRPTPGGGGLTLVNNLDLESYLRGVVPWEIGRHERNRMAALEAQAVAARTYTLSHLGTRKSRGFDLYASVQDQSTGDPLTRIPSAMKRWIIPPAWYCVTKRKRLKPTTAPVAEECPAISKKSGHVGPSLI